MNSGEYKLMGLAPYGKPRYVDVILDRLVDHGRRIALAGHEYFNYGQGLTMTSPRFHDLFGGPPRKPEGLITQKEMDLAASIQVVCEDAMLRARAPSSSTHRRAHAWSWPAAWRSTAWRTAVCSREGPFENIWIQPAAGDAGGALGAALLVWHHEMNQPRATECARCPERLAARSGVSPTTTSVCSSTAMGATYEALATRRSCWTASRV